MKYFKISLNEMMKEELLGIAKMFRPQNMFQDMPIRIFCMRLQRGR